MPYFGVPIRNGLPIGLGTLTALAQAVAVVVPPVSSDPYFEYVSLLANTTSTNGAQNNTFLDGSTNAFSVTRNGNTTQGTFSPFSQTGWSNYFDGTGDYLSVPRNNAFLPVANEDFTVEAWVYLTATPGATEAQIVGFGEYGLDADWFFGINSSLQVGFYINATITFYRNTTTALTLNSWNHVAASRSGTGSNNLTVYVNGVGQSFTTNSTTVGTGLRNLTISADQNGDEANLTGYISNLRIVKGTAVYTANFTPPTAPLTAITNTSLLTCQSNRFIDNSSNAFAITRNGDVSVQAFSPFNPTAAWSASTNGGSGYFDGTGDYLSVADNVALEPGTGDFCLEAWVYFNALGIGNIYNAQQSGPSISLNASNQIEFGQSYVSVLLTDTVAATTGQWYHVAVCRSGTTLSMFVNGSRRATATNSTNFNTTVANYIGWNGGAAYFNGYLSNLRLVKGSAVYDPTLTTLTVPTAPLTAITNTSLLLNFTNAGIYDSASGNDLETVGNAQVSTVQAKWGTTSMAFDGTGDWLTVPDSPTQRFGTGDFTVEFWMYVTGGLPPAGIIGKGTSTTGWEISWQTGRTLRFTFGSTSATSVATFNNNTWYHVALVRSGSAVGNVKLYLDGTAILTSGTAVTDNLNQTNVMYVGANRTGANAFTGYIDDLRITNGYARYTANFTPPTAAFPLN